MPVALERDDGVHQVLERARAGERAVLRDVADEHDGDAVALRHVHEPEGGFANLAHAACGSVELVHRRRLDRVHDEERRALAAGELGDPSDVGLRHDADRRRDALAVDSQPGRAEPHLAGGLLSRGVEDAGAAGGSCGQAGGHLEEQRRLADSGLPADEHERAGHESPAEDPIELTDPDGQPGGVVGDGLGQRHRRQAAGDRAAVRPPDAYGLADRGLDEAVPGRAGTALALPAEERLAAALADEAALGAGHGGRPRRLRPGSSSRRR